MALSALWLAGVAHCPVGRICAEHLFALCAGELLPPFMHALLCLLCESFNPRTEAGSSPAVFVFGTTIE
jgi:hypothetical protein